ncbi:MAG: ribosome small subunit-dependent GTPase A [Candidatus Latescibacterota bacterium]
MDLVEVGWGEDWIRTFAPLAMQGLAPGRVIRLNGPTCTVLAAPGELTGELAGRLRHRATSAAKLPAVGDWVGLRLLPGEERAVVEEVLPRRTCFSRRAAGGRDDEQVLAANLDTVFLICGLDRDFNLRRLERYLTLAWDSGAAPVAVLNKADLCDRLAERVAQVEGLGGAFPVHPVSATAMTGLEPLRPYLGPGRTVALLGSSGVGKSTLLNALIGREVARVGALRTGDGKGRHTTTHRELILLPGGGALIDTPGMRELQLWADSQSLGDTFEEIEAFAGECRFTDCTHLSEPGCAVLLALREGRLSATRLESWRKQERELRHLASRQGDQEARRQIKERGRRIALWARQWASEK